MDTRRLRWIRTATLTASLAWLGAETPAQQLMQSRPLPGPVKDAGTYHLATRTWSRAGQTENFGSKILYFNTANTGYFGSTGVPADLVWTDEGRVPSSSGHSNAKADVYTVKGFQIAYCSSVTSGPQQVGLTFFEVYASCTDPSIIPPTSGPIQLLLPGGATSSACWTVSIDLKNSSFEFNLNGDADGVFDASSALDDFGWTIEMADQGTGGFNGPLLTGDPNNFPHGDGTYFQNSGASIGTGLGTLDQFYLNDSTGLQVNGCYWFGGYGSGNPFASFWLVLSGDNGSGDEFGTKYCIANPNSTGAPADLVGSGSCPEAGDISFVASPVPNQPGIFFHAANQAQIPFGNGFLCATGNIVRGAVVIGSGNAASYSYDNSDIRHSLLDFVNSTRNFQFWFRDPSGGGSFFNLSNAVSVALTAGCGGGIDITSFDPSSATSGTLVNLQGAGFGGVFEDLAVTVIDTGGDMALSLPTSAAFTAMQMRVEGLPPGMSSGRIRVQRGDGESWPITLPPEFVHDGVCWSWVDAGNDGPTAFSDTNIQLYGNGPMPGTCGGPFYYGKVQNGRLRIVIPAGAPVPVNSRVKVRVGVTTEGSDYVLYGQMDVRTTVPLTTCGLAEGVAEILEFVFDQHHGLSLTCVTSQSGSCASNPEVTIIASGPDLRNLVAGRGAVEVCPP